MDQASRAINVDVVEDCVRILGGIDRELQEATRAIACHKLSDFEESLWRQETLCARLKRSVSAIRSTVSDQVSAKALREATSRLSARTQTYEKLVTQSRRSTEILQHLCSLYRNAVEHPVRASYRSISREV